MYEKTIKAYGAFAEACAAHETNCFGSVGPLDAVLAACRAVGENSQLTRKSNDAALRALHTLIGSYLDERDARAARDAAVALAQKVAAESELK